MADYAFPWEDPRSPLYIPQRRDPPIRPFRTDEETDTALQLLGGKAVGGLAWLGERLDKAFGGRAIRGLLGGRPREALSVLPFSDKLGITDPGEIVSGEDLLKKWGMLRGEGEKGKFELRDLAGPLVEIALDPSTYLTLGTTRALTAAGQAARRAGKLAPTAAERIARGQAGLIGIGLPFGTKMPIGTGPTAQRIAGHLDRLGDRLLYSHPVRHLSALFDPRVTWASASGQAPLSEAGQRAARKGFELFKRGEAGVRGEQAMLSSALREAGALERPQEVRMAVEQLIHPIDPNVRQVTDHIRAQGQRMLELENDLGIPTGQLEDNIPYAARYRKVLGKETKGYGGYARQDFPVGHPSMEHRESIFRNIPRGSAGVEEIARDTQILNILQQHGQEAAADYVLTSHLGWTAKHDRELAYLRDQLSAQGKKLPPAAVKRMADLEGRMRQARELVKWRESVDPAHVTEGFWGHPVTDFAMRRLHHERATASASVIHDMLAEHAVRAPTAAGPDMVPLRQALKDAGLTWNYADEVSGIYRGSEASQAKRLAELGKAQAGLPSELENMVVPKAIAEDAARYSRAVTSPAGLEPFLKVFDGITNLTKIGQTAIWPAFHVRNLVSGAFMNWVTGAGYKGADPVTAYVGPYLDARRMLRGETIKGAARRFGYRGLTDEQATKALANEIYAHGVTQRGMFGEVVGLGQHAQPTPWLPGEKTEALGSMIRSAFDFSRPGSLNPLNIAGVASTRDIFAPAVAGRNIGTMVEDLNRISHYLARRSQGYVPETATLLTKQAQFDYGNLTPFERRVMRRAIPFYSWMRNNIPFTLETLIHEPGGRLGTAIKLAGRMRQETGFLPSYLGEGVALPIGDERDGTQRYLTQLGLPFEDFAQTVNLGPNWRRSAQSLLSQTNPLIKAPLELAFGTQLYSGRDLEDLRPITGSLILDQAIMGSPISRAYTTGRTLADPRKGFLARAINVGTGMRVSDVDMEKQRDIAAREEIEKRLKGTRGVSRLERLYVRPEDLAQLTPEEVLMMRLYQTLDRRRAERLRKQEGR